MATLVLSETSTGTDQTAQKAVNSIKMWKDMFGISCIGMICFLFAMAESNVTVVYRVATVLVSVWHHLNYSMKYILVLA